MRRLSHCCPLDPFHYVPNDYDDQRLPAHGTSIMALMRPTLRRLSGVCLYKTPHSARLVLGFKNTGRGDIICHH